MGAVRSSQLTDSDCRAVGRKESMTTKRENRPACCRCPSFGPPYSLARLLINLEDSSFALVHASPPLLHPFFLLAVTCRPTPHSRGPKRLAAAEQGLVFAVEASAYVGRASAKSKSDACVASVLSMSGVGSSEAPWPLAQCRPNDLCPSTPPFLHSFENPILAFSFTIAQVHAKIGSRSSVRVRCWIGVG